MPETTETQPATDQARLLDNKVAIVTGASSGIGRAIAFRFAREGARVVVSSRDRSRCDAVTDAILKEMNKAVSIPCDVSREDEVGRLFDEATDAFGEVDVAVANAGVSGGTRRVADYTLEDWNRVMATNLTGVFLTVREAYRRMTGRGGHIILMSSMAGIRGYAQKGAYCAAKFGARGLGQALAEEGRADGIVVSTICPSVVNTPILAATNTQLKNPIDPSAIAELAVFLARQSGNSMIREVAVESLRTG